MLKQALILFSILSVGACDGKNIKYEYPKNSYEKKIEEKGSFLNTGKNSGIDIFNFKQSKNENSTIAMNVNSVLYKASLDVLSFMPLQQSDPIGGVIITDWYSDPATPQSKIKINIMILDKELKASALKVNAFKQVIDKNGNWISVEVNKSLIEEIESKIINKAREYNLHEKVKQ